MKLGHIYLFFQLKRSVSMAAIAIVECSLSRTSGLTFFVRTGALEIEHLVRKYVILA